MTVGASIFLASYLEPLAPFLSRPDVTDIYINRPGELWLEPYSGPIERHDVPGLTRETLHRLARQIAALTAQGISRDHPLLAARLPTGERVQIIAPPATRGEIAVAIRKHLVSSLSLADFGGSEAEIAVTRPGEPDPYAAKGTVAEILARAVTDRKTILICGGTSSGKTTLLNSLLNEIPANERLISIEDTPELNLTHANSVGLIAARSALREAKVDMSALLTASLRMRPDRIIVGEIRGNEAVTFLRAVNTGHPGSLSTIHADSCDGAVNQLAFLALEAGLNLSWDNLRNYIHSVIDIIVNVSRARGEIKIRDLSFLVETRS